MPDWAYIDETHGAQPPRRMPADRAGRRQEVKYVNRYDARDDGPYDDEEELYGDEGDEELEEPTVPCPYCRREIHEDAQRCPYCEQYISAEDAPAWQKPWWLLLGVAICLLIVLSWFL